MELVSVAHTGRFLQGPHNPGTDTDTILRICSSDTSLCLRLVISKGREIIALFSTDTCHIECRSLITHSWQRRVQ